MRTIQNLRLFCIMLFVMLITMNFANAQNSLVTESFESETLPIGWKIIDANDDGQTWRIWQVSSWAHTGSHSIGNPGYSSQVQADDYLITPKLFINETNHTVSFYGRSTHADRPETVEVRVSTTGNESDDFTDLLQTIVLPMLDEPVEDALFDIDLSDYNNQAIYFAFRCISPAQSNIAIIDDVTFPKQNPEVDLAAGEFTNERGLIPNYPNQMFLSINNSGMLPVHKYTVNVYDADGTNDLLQTSVFTETITPGQDKIVEFTLTLPTIGTYNLIAEVIAEGDDELGNNQTLAKEFNVEEDLYFQIGDATISNLCDFPTATSFKSLTQSIYDTDVMNVYEGLEIVSLTYFAAVGNNTGSKDIVMYIGETDREDLTDGNGMVPASEMQEVYNGVISINATGPVTITLDTPYKYSGKKNLVIMTNKTSGGIPYAGWRKTAPIKDGISLLYQNQQVNFDPNNPNDLPAGSWTEDHNYLPTTKFTFSNNEVVEVGSMSGVVTEDEQPVSGATVLIEELEQSIYTNENGEYSFVSVRTGTYNVTAVKEGLAPQTVSDVLVEKDANTTVDFALVEQEEMTDPTNLSAVIKSDGNVLFSWVHTDENALNFEVFLDDVSKGTTQELEYLFDEAFVNNQTYTLGVVAHYQTGSTPMQTYELLYQEKTLPANLGTVITAEGKVLFSWAHNNESVVNFEVFLDGVSKGTTQELEYLFDETFVNNQTYTFGVVANYQSGNTPVQTFELVYQEMANPTNLAAVITEEGKVLFSWTHTDENAVDFEVFLDDVSKGTTLESEYLFDEAFVNNQTYTLGVVAHYQSGSTAMQTYQLVYESMVNPTNLGAVITGEGKVLFSWTHTDENAVDFEVFLDDVSKGTTLESEYLFNETFVNNQTYTFGVVANYQSGNTPVQTFELVYQEMANPTNLAAVITEEGKVLFSWTHNDENAINYEVFLDGTSKGTTTYLEYLFNETFVNSQTYILGVIAHYQSGSTNLQTYEFTYEEMVNPTNLAAVITEEGKVLFSWMHNQENVVNYEVFLDDVSKGTTLELEYLFDESFESNQVYTLGVVAHYQAGSTPIQTFTLVYIYNSVQEQELLEVKVYPVPSNGIVNVDLQENSIIRVVDQLGKVVYYGELRAGTSQLDLSFLHRGIYYSIFHNQDNSKQEVRKILIK